MRYEDIPSIAVWENDSVPPVQPPPVAPPRPLAGPPNRLPPPVPFKPNSMGMMPPPLPPRAPAPGPPVPPRPTTGLSMSRQRLAQIDAEIKTYHQAFSPMAKRNVLVSLQRAITAWSVGYLAPLPPPMAALKEVVDRKLALRPSNARYDKAICIAFHTGCNYQKSTNTTHAIGGRTDLNKDYFRHSENDMADMQMKCRALWKAIETASDGIRVHNLANNNRTLKIFMAPEFYFRGRNGAYSPEVVSEIVPLMRGFGAAKANFGDWLFVFGTAVAAIEVTKTYCVNCNSYGTIQFVRNPLVPSKTIPKCTVNSAHTISTWTSGAEVQNIALISHGSSVHMVAKEYVSGIDYTGDQVRVHPGQANQADLNVMPPLGSTDNPGNAVVQNDERLGGCIFTVDGITVGLEVCLDHSLAQPGQAEFGRASNLAATIQILLIPSYGMTIGAGMHCKAGGIAFNVDGRGTGNSEVKLNTGTMASQTATAVGSTISLYGPFDIPS